MSRCTGHCCKAFPLSVSYERLCELAADSGEIAGKPVGGHPDASFILDMVVRLPDSEEGREMFSCRHLAESGDCSVYDQRPQMCWDYPYGKPCEQAGRTYVAEPAAERLVMPRTGVDS